MRFPVFYLNDYFYLSENEWDAITFVPKRNVKFLGFGAMGNYHKKDMKYKIKWVIDGEESEEHTIEVKEAEDRIENKWYLFRLKDLGVKPIKVSDGGKIDICMKCCSDDYEYRRTSYGYHGYQDRYCKIEGQDYDFDMKTSELNCNNTSESWGQIPVILYQ